MSIARDTLGAAHDMSVPALLNDDWYAYTLAEQSTDPVVALRSALQVGARVLLQQSGSADVEAVKRELNQATKDFEGVLTRLLDPEQGVLIKELDARFDDTSTKAVPHQLRQAVQEALERGRERTDGVLRESLGNVATQISALRTEREVIEAVAEEAERGTAKGRVFEEVALEVVDAIASGHGDVCEGVGDTSGPAGKAGDVLVSIDAATGQPRGRIVFEVKTGRLSRPEAIRDLDRALEARDADFAVLVVPDEGKLPAGMTALREFNGDKLIATLDQEMGPLVLQTAYSLARARVLMGAGGEEIDAEAVRGSVERAVLALEDVRRVKSSLTAASTTINETKALVDAMVSRARAELTGLLEAL